MSSIPDDDYHQLLVHQNLERIELAAAQAFEQQLEIPVVLLLDMADPVASAIIESAGLQAQIEPLVAEFQRRGVVTVLIKFLPGRCAHDLLENYYPDLDEFIPLSDSNAFYTVILSRSGMTMGELRLP